MNPALYTLGRGASYAACFHDITTGNNFNSSSPSQFSAVSGYDLCTGWGTPNGTNLINALTAPPVPMPSIVSNSFTLLAESCPNGFLDPGETVTVGFGLQNVGTANTTNLVVTLLATGGIVSPDGPFTYGVLVTNGVPVTQAFTFTTSGNCGDTNTATLQLQDATADLGTVAFSFRLGQAVSSNVATQNFDGVTAPALPAGWTTSTSDAASNWVTSTSTRDSLPNAAFAAEPAYVGVGELVSPAITIPSASTQLTFRNSFNTEADPFDGLGYDGGVLEIKVGSGSFTDILAAGGSFISGGYTRTIDPTDDNPLGGRQAWSGSSGGWIDTVVSLPSAAVGQSIQLKWRFATDTGNAYGGTGWYIDTVVVGETHYTCCSNAPPAITTQPASLAALPGTEVTFQVAAAGAEPLSFQWSFNGTNLDGAASSTLTLTNVQQAQAGTYAVLVTNSYGSLLSSNAVLTLLEPLVISAQPVGQTVLAGSVVSFTAGVSGFSPLSCQWQRGGTNLVDGGKVSGSASASLTVSNVQAADMGSYGLVVTNVYGAVTSAPALLSVWPWLGWGRDEYGQADIPGGLSNVIAMAGGVFHSLALRTDGTVAAWGGGAANTGVSPQYGQSMVPVGLSNVMAVTAGAYHSLALGADGTVAAWGAGATNTGVLPQYGQTLVPAGLSNVMAIAGGGYHSLALKADGTVAVWGDNTYGQANAPAGLSGVVAIAAGGFHNLALKVDGTVAAWGAGMTNSGTGAQYGQSLVPADLSNAVAVAAGAYHSLALKADGTVVAWGLNSSGQTNVPAGLTNAVAVAAGYLHSLALRSDGTAVAWGNSAYGQANLPSGLLNVVRLAPAAYHNLMMESDGRPTLTVQPLSHNAAAGTRVQLVGMAAGVPSLRYQWQLNGSDLAGASLNSYTLPAVQAADAGTYVLRVTNGLGSAVSANAVLTVASRPVITSFGLQSDGSFIVRGSGGAGQSYVLLMVPSLVPPLVWSGVQTNQADTQGLFQLTDPGAASQRQRFYRVGP